MATGREQANHRRSRLWTASVGALALILVAAIAVSLNGPPEPVYRGAGLSEWLAGSNLPPGRNPFVLSFQMEQALLKREQVFQEVGPEALPWLLNTLPRADFRRRVNRLASNLCGQHPLVNRFVSPRLDFSSGTSELNALNLIARLAPATPYETRAVRRILAIQAADNHGLATLRLRALGCFTNCPERVIAPLISGLTNSATVDGAIDGLQQFGSTATPYLYPLALRETGIIRPAEVALEHADPPAYGRLREQKDHAPGP